MGYENYISLKLLYVKLIQFENKFELNFMLSWHALAHNINNSIINICKTCKYAM